MDGNLTDLLQINTSTMWTRLEIPSEIEDKSLT